VPDTTCRDCGRRHAASYEEWQAAWFDTLGRSHEGLCGAGDADTPWNEDNDHEDAVIDCLQVTNLRLKVANATAKRLLSASLNSIESDTWQSEVEDFLNGFITVHPEGRQGG
jgi:hypothetical protein